MTINASRTETIENLERIRILYRATRGKPREQFKRGVLFYLWQLYDMPPEERGFVGVKESDLLLQHTVGEHLAVTRAVLGLAP
jgi:hypothetical protein